MFQAEDSVEVNLKEQCFMLKLVVRKVSFVILVSLPAITSSTLFVHLSRFIWNKKKDLCFSGNFKDQNGQCHSICKQHFQGHFLSTEVFLN